MPPSQKITIIIIITNICVHTEVKNIFTRVSLIFFRTNLFAFAAKFHLVKEGEYKYNFSRQYRLIVVVKSPFLRS